MDIKRTNILILLMIIIIAGGSACSLGKINAQSPTNKTETARVNPNDSGKSTYEQPKRISKDIIKSDVKAKK